MRRALITLVAAFFVTLVILCFLWPGTVAVAAVSNFSAWRDTALSPRRLGLLARGIWVASAAATLAQVIGAALACGLAGHGAKRSRGFITWICLCVLLTPPYVYAYGWSLPLLPQGLPTADVLAAGAAAWFATVGRAIGCLATWSAPVAAFILAAGWRTHGRPALNLAILDADGPQAARRAVLPVMWPWFAISFTCTWILALTEYSVCHLCLVQTWNTEILAELQLLDTRGGGLALAWPLMLVAATALLALLLRPRRLREMLDEIAHLDSAERIGEAARGRRWPRRLIVGGAVAALLLPGAIFVSYFRDPAAFITAWSTFPGRWPNSLLCAGGSALMCIVLAIGVDFLMYSSNAWRLPRCRWAARLVIASSAVAAICPPALIGDTFAATYAGIPLVADHWLIVSLVSASRFSILTIVALLLNARTVHPQLLRMAAGDGASPVDAYLRVRLPICLPSVLWAGLATLLLSLTEVAATLMVQPPEIPNLAVTLLNQIHFGRNDQVIAMMLYLILFVGIVVGLLIWVSAGQRRRTRSMR